MFLNRNSPRCIENLSNDLLLEIFEYFHVYELCKAFEISIIDFKLYSILHFIL